MIPLSSANSKGLYPPETHSTALTASDMISEARRVDVWEEG